MTTSPFYSFAVRTIKHEPFDMQQLAGKVVLLVNTASKCGFTPQYDGLEKLHDQYKDRGLVVLGFPCNQFGGQEPGTEEGKYHLLLFIRLYETYGYSYSTVLLDQIQCKVSHDGKG
jgi:glutathione peroxidase-family protein